MVRRAIVWCSFLVASVPAQSNEILGFKIGATMDEARSAAARIKSEMQDVTLGAASQNYRAFVVSPIGPQIGFCNGKMVSLQIDMSGSFHEFVSALEKNQRDLGQPRTKPQQTYAGGKQLSSINLEWPKPDGVLTTLSMWSLGDGKFNTTSGFFQPNPCSQ